MDPIKKQFLLLSRFSCLLLSLLQHGLSLFLLCPYPKKSLALTVVCYVFAIHWQGHWKTTTSPLFIFSLVPRLNRLILPVHSTHKRTARSLPPTTDLFSCSTMALSSIQNRQLGLLWSYLFCPFSWMCGIICHAQSSPSHFSRGPTR